MERFGTFSERKKRAIVSIGQLPALILLSVYLCGVCGAVIWVLCGTAICSSVLCILIYIIDKLEYQCKREERIQSEVYNTACFKLKKCKDYFRNVQRCAIGDKLRLVKEGKRYYVYDGSFKIGLVSSRTAKQAEGKELYIYDFAIHSMAEDPLKGIVFTVVVQLA